VQIAAQFGTLTRWSAGVDDERLDDAQQMLDKFREIGVGVPEPGPVDVELAHHRVTEIQRDV
jgi:hypothetical protein